MTGGISMGIIMAKKSEISYKWNGLEFSAYRQSKLIFSGQINENKITEIENSNFSTEIQNFFVEYGITTGKRDQSTYLDKTEKRMKANFFFIRGLLDYANIVPSHFFWLNMIDLMESHPFLFDPLDLKWNGILFESSETKIKLLYPFLIRFNGFFRRRFEKDINSWLGIIKFLKENCNGDASLFYLTMCKTLNIDPQKSSSLEEMQQKLEKLSGRKKKELGINFPYGKKASRLMINLMGNTKEGSLLDGVTKSHLDEFFLPVDSQIIRVTLNSGLIDLKQTENIELKKWGIDEGKGAILTREEFSEPCQKAWHLLSQKIPLSPSELDYYIWQVGSLFGKKFGRFCYTCPMAKWCDSWKEKKIKESDVSHSSEGCFNFCRPNPRQDFLLLRGCENCDHNSRNLQNKRCDSCNKVKTFSQDRPWVNFADIELYLEENKNKERPKKNLEKFFVK
jgi:hypothetical protein